MPRPKQGESKRDYISRAIPMMIHEGLELKAAQGKAFGMWRTYRGGGKKKRGKK